MKSQGQMLRRTVPAEARAAEILRALYPRPRGKGDKIGRPELYDTIADRRALENEAMHDLISYQGKILRRPSTSGMALMYQSMNILLAMGLVTRGKRRGVIIIEDSGRHEAELWFPELRVQVANADVFSEERKTSHG